MIDFVIVILYLLAMLIIGFWQSRNIETLADFAVSKQRYSGVVMGIALSATILGGGSTIGIAEKVFSVGIIFIIAVMGQPINKLFIAYLVAPKMDRFRGMISAGDIMGSFYGNPGKVITGFVGSLMSIGFLGAQVNAIGYLFNYFLGISHIYGVIIGTGIVIIYTVSGGIKAVTMTDLFQFSILIVTIPMIAIVSLFKAGSFHGVFSHVPPQHILIDQDPDILFKYCTLLLIFAIPLLNPAIIQRLLMTKNSKESVKGILITASISCVFLIIAGFIGLIALAINPSMDANLALPHLISSTLPIGLKGFAIAGMLAVIMSTADSDLNVASISIVNDIIKPLSNASLSHNAELVLTRIATIIVGILSITTSLFFNNIYDIILGSLMIWGPVVVVPLYAGFFQVKASSRTFILGALAGVLTWTIWNILFKTSWHIGALLPSIAMNAFVFFIAHKFQTVRKQIC